jgi:hypothetical protein
MDRLRLVPTAALTNRGVVILPPWAELAWRMAWSGIDRPAGRYCPPLAHDLYLRDSFILVHDVQFECKTSRF